MKNLLKKYWGYESFRPFQEEIIANIVRKSDTLSILPTGGGKSLCFQIPALASSGMAVVISPLIALMKDQVDGLKEMGIAAACYNSSLSSAEQMEIWGKIRKQEIKLLYLAPERLKNAEMIQLLQSIELSFFVIDEAHCISEWGHDFRDDYRQLKLIKENFAQIPVHAFTATATPEVQNDIVNMLGLQNPSIRIAPVDRSNLTYRLIQRTQLLKQVVQILKKHPDAPGIIYCLRRSDVDSLSESLNALGYKNVPYHAGLPDLTRQKNQELFTRESVDLVVATIAFGMGIDRSNIRYVIHAAMPKNIEQYQQETGRAGRDGLASACYLLYGGGDYHTWSRILADSSNQNIMMEKMQAIYRLCTQPQCRHQALVAYFGQEYSPNNCQACDYCLGEIETINDSLIVAQKILSCVVRAEQRFGADHIAHILKGDLSANITRWGHEKLSTFGLLQDKSIFYIRSLIEQLVGQNYLLRSGEYQTLSITSLGREVLQGKTTPTLAAPMLAAKKKKSIEQAQKKSAELDWENIDQKLFAALRHVRRKLSDLKGVPAYFIFSDKTLKEITKHQPTNMNDFAGIYGVGEQKLQAYAQIFIDEIKTKRDQSVTTQSTAADQARPQ